MRPRLLKNGSSDRVPAYSRPFKSYNTVLWVLLVPCLPFEVALLATKILSDVHIPCIFLETYETYLHVPSYSFCHKTCGRFGMLCFLSEISQEWNCTSIHVSLCRGTSQGLVCHFQYCRLIRENLL